MEAQGTYKVKDTGEEISYSFNYLVLEGDSAEAKIEFAVAQLGAGKIAGDIQRMVKLDANNPAREKAKVTNGHSTRAVLTEEQKAENKAQRKANSELLAMLKAKGLSLADIESM